MDTSAESKDEAARMLNARFEHLASRLHAVEAKGGSGRNIMLSLASGLALIISIATGGFTIYERVVMEPEREKQALFDEFERTFTELNSVNAAVQMEIGRAASPEQAAMINATQSARIGPLLDNLERLESKTREQLTAQHYSVLAWFNWQMYDFEGARQHSARALELDPSPIVEGRIYRLLGMIEMQRHTPEAYGLARDDVEKAIAAFQRSDDGAAPALVADARIDLIYIALALTGDCEALPGLAQAFLQDASHPAVQPQHKLSNEMRFAAMTYDPAAKCMLPASLPRASGPAFSPAAGSTAPAPIELGVTPQ